jgi:hypothetical protein
LVFVNTGHTDLFDIVKRVQSLPIEPSNGQKHSIEELYDNNFT